MSKFFFEAYRHKLLQLETHLTKHQYFSKDYLPGLADALMFEIFDQQFPDRRIFPAIYYWFINVKQFSRREISGWKIRSEQDDQYRAFLDHYTKWKQEIQNHVAQAQDPVLSRAFVKSQYIISINLKTDQKSELNTLLTHIQKNTTSIRTCNFIKDNAQLEIKCNGREIETLKLGLDECDNVRNYQLKRKKGMVTGTGNGKGRVGTSAFLLI